MGTPPSSARLHFRRSAPPGAGHYEVLYEGSVMGTVGRFRLGAGQFGSHWMATSPDGRRSGRYATREAAAAWLMGQAGRDRRS
jgi:hypothetical protein